MATPRELLRRARAQTTVVRRETTPVQPEPVREVAPPMRRNSVYHQLMQRHDRAHTRHIQP